MRRIFSCQVAFALLGLFGRLSAQDCHVVLQGHVTEAETGEPLAYATVYVHEVERGAVTDENGFFAVNNLCAGRDYTVEVRHVECAHMTQVVRLTENVATDFHLLHNAVLGEVLVAEKALPPSPVQAESTVASSDLAATQGVNLGETLKKLPGVTTLNTGATIAKPVIQGLHSNRIAIVTDGVALEGQQWGSEHAPEIDPFTAEKITVVKGAAGLRYGVGALAGAVVLEPAPLRTETGLGGWLSLGGFSNGWGGVASGAVDWRLPGRSLTLRLQGTAKRSGNLRAPDYWLGNTGASELNFSARAGWKSGRWIHEWSVSRFAQRLAILRAAHVGNLTDLQKAIASDRPLNNPDVFSYEIDRPYQKIAHHTVNIKSSYRFSETWKLNLRYAFQSNDREEYDVVRNNSSAADRPQVGFQLWTNTLDAALEHFPIDHWEGGVGVQAIQQTNVVGRGGFIPDFQAWGGSVWLTERWRKFPNPWEFEFGGRYDYRMSHTQTEGNLIDLDTTVRFGNASAAAGVMYRFSRQLSVTLHSGLAWRPPTVNELFARGIHHGSGTYEQGRADLAPEKAWNSNLTLSWQRGRSELTLTLYRNQIRDFIYLDPQNTFVLTVRGAFPAFFYAQADAVVQGIDGSLSWPVSKRLSLEGRVSLLRGYRMARDSGEQTSHHDWLPLMPVDRFQYGVKWSLPNPRSSKTSETYVRLLASTALQQSRLPEAGLLKAAPGAFTTFSLDAAHTFQWKNQPLEVGLSIQNMTNLRYREYLNFFRFYADEPGINVGLRAKWTFS
ncbi:MAG: TonB-dependent receptor [Saprospiraceae bacterium]|nr:TonB-dependent receptor [Saprospiraceae bacterium]